MFLLKLTTLILSATFLYGEEKFKKPNLGYTDIEKLKSGTEIIVFFVRICFAKKHLKTRFSPNMTMRTAAPMDLAQKWP